MFEIGRYYTRTEIHDQVGGGVQDFLPHVEGRVVCVCVTPQLNPSAPDVLLVGDGENIQRYGDALIAQQVALPMFIKRGVNQWEYRGEYSVSGSSSDSREVARWAALANRDDMTKVVYLRLAGSEATVSGSGGHA